MKIISRGSLPQKKTYTAHCGKCKSVIEFMEEEARIVHDRNEVLLVAECPVCKSDMWIKR